MYTIKLKEDGIGTVSWVATKLDKAVKSKQSRFTATFRVADAMTIEVKPVRLRDPKPYCGQHPGECAVGGSRKRTCYLEWEDWVEFHDLLNAQLDRLQVNADIWTNPTEKMDVGRKMWVRRGLKSRKRWDFESYVESFGRILTIWNHGTPDQFDPGPK